MASSFVRVNQLSEDIAQAVHDFFGSAGGAAHTLKVMLTNTLPNIATVKVKADIIEITSGHGYNGPVSTANSGTRTGGTTTIIGQNITWQAAGGTIGPFRYAVLFNDTQTVPAKPVLGYWDLGSARTLADTQQVALKFNSGGTSGAMFTL